LKPSFDATPPKDTLVGSVERVTFHNEDSGFAVLKVKARGQRDLVPVVGHAASISAGEFIHAVGVWITDRTHGLQFKADFLKTTPPTTAEGIEKYLGSGMVRGIGPKLAERIVAVFGAATFEIIEASPEKLRDVSGIGEFRAGKIAAGWAEQKAIRDIMLFLHSNGVGTSRAVRIFKTYGHDAIHVMTEDPYRLARDIRGIGFRTADAIAMKLGMTREAPQRVRAGISFALQEATDEGHCGLPAEDLIKLATTLLEVDASGVDAALAHEIADSAPRSRWSSGQRRRWSRAAPAGAKLRCSTPSCASSLPRERRSYSRRRPAEPPSECPSRPASKPRPSTGCSKPIPRLAGSNATPRTGLIATFSSSTRPACSTPR
jgi:exodeoxyribonuclease V alpha subunit